MSWKVSWTVVEEAMEGVVGGVMKGRGRCHGRCHERSWKAMEGRGRCRGRPWKAMRKTIRRCTPGRAANEKGNQEEAHLDVRLEESEVRRDVLDREGLELRRGAKGSEGERRGAKVSEGERR